jgi:hypothetical protein
MNSTGKTLILRKRPSNVAGNRGLPGQFLLQFNV